MDQKLQYDARTPEKIFAVSEFIDYLNTFFEKHDAKIAGEIMECKIAVSGHVYFTIKDKSGDGVLDCVIWRSAYRLCGLTLKEGMEIIVAGHPNIYKKQGRLSFITSTIELVGEGALKKAYDDLKRKLEKEGVFAPAKKRDIPRFPQRIGVVTSREGAVIHDFMNNLGKFGYKISLIDSRVEGQAATKDLLAGIKIIKKEEIDVLVVIRGGGSLESMQAFNNEYLVREIATFPVPVIAGIGHDKDVPLSALAADFMVSTPTAAANLLNRSWEEAYAKLNQIPYILARIEQEFKKIRIDLLVSWRSVLDAAAGGINSIKQKLDYAGKTLKLNDPTHQLKLGYGIVRKHGKVIKTIADLKNGEKLETQLSDGSVESRVEKTRKIN